MYCVLVMNKHHLTMVLIFIHRKTLKFNFSFNTRSIFTRFYTWLQDSSVLSLLLYNLRHLCTLVPHFLSVALTRSNWVSGTRTSNKPRPTWYEVVATSAFSLPFITATATQICLDQVTQVLTLFAMLDTFPVKAVTTSEQTLDMAWQEHSELEDWLTSG